jgi:hypothetical protein
MSLIVNPALLQELLSPCFHEKIVLLPGTYMVNDHRQSQAHQITGAFSARDAANRSLPHHDTVPLLANFNHLQASAPPPPFSY